MRYVTVDGSDIAYQVIGDRPNDVLWMYALGSQIDLVWQLPRFAASLERLKAFARVLIFDRRGSGASDPAPPGGVPNWELFSEDIGSVMSAAGSERAAVIGFRDTGQMAMLYAAMHPERVSALVLLNTTARYSDAPDHPTGEPPGKVEGALGLIRSLWGTPDLARVTSPDLAGDPVSMNILAMMQRASASPTQATAQMENFLRHGDVRQALPSIQAPTLVLHVQDSAFLPIAHGRYLAENIPGARLVELPGGDIGGGLMDGALEEIAEFLTGVRPAASAVRVLTTVLFTDIVMSTQRVAEVGDQRWRELLDAHDHAMREQIQRFRGQEINTTGDGFVASFDGPGRAILCAQAMREATRELGLELHLGLHTGECEVRGTDLAGLTVHIAARVCAQSAPGVIVVSRTVADLVAGSGFTMDDLGERELKGVPGAWRLFAVAD